MSYIKVERATELLGNENKQQTYRQVRERLIPPGVAFRIGKAIRFDEVALREWVARGGTALSVNTESAAQSATA